jgi:hypothetical protein
LGYGRVGSSDCAPIDLASSPLNCMSVFLDPREKRDIY